MRRACRALSLPLGEIELGLLIRKVGVNTSRYGKSVSGERTISHSSKLSTYP